MKRYINFTDFSYDTRSGKSKKNSVDHIGIN